MTLTSKINKVIEHLHVFPSKDECLQLLMETFPDGRNFEELAKMLGGYKSELERLNTLENNDRENKYIKLSKQELIPNMRSKIRLRIFRTEQIERIADLVPIVDESDFQGYENCKIDGHIFLNICQFKKESSIRALAANMPMSRLARIVDEEDDRTAEERFFAENINTVGFNNFIEKYDLWPDHDSMRSYQRMLRRRWGAPLPASKQENFFHELIIADEKDIVNCYNNMQWRFW